MDELDTAKAQAMPAERERQLAASAEAAAASTEAVPVPVETVASTEAVPVPVETAEAAVFTQAAPVTAETAEAAVFTQAVSDEPEYDMSTEERATPNAYGNPEAKTGSKFKSIAAIVALASVLGGFSIGVGIGVVGTLAGLMQPETSAEAAPAFEPSGASEVLAFNNQPSYAPSADEDLPGSFSEIVSRVEPAVVDISSVMSSNQSFFGLPESPRGSGIIFKEDSEKVYIVTNYHVVSGADSVSVSIAGSSPVNAGLVGKEQASDIAVIYVTKADLKTVGVERVTLAAFGDSDKMQMGDIVLAIGNAMGEGNTATQGIISAKNKEIKVENIKLIVIQTDAAINPGNSGGPLVNMRGEVIGMNTAKTMEQYFGSSAEGMGYSISANIIVPIVDEIMLMKPKAFLGIGGRTLPKEVAEQFDIPELGVLVEEVYTGSAADEAGLRRTDIITAFKGEPVFTMEELKTAVTACEVGETVELKLLRDGKTPMMLKVKLQPSENGSF